MHGQRGNLGIERSNKCFRCPVCKHGFIRKLRASRQKVSCPKCANRFNTNPPPSDEEIDAIKTECFQRKQEHTARLFRNVSPTKFDLVIRGGQIPNSRAEARFKALALEKGWKPHRPSWPDFIVETDNGIIVVEVKSKHDCVSPTQKATFDILESLGIPVFLWKAQTNKYFMRWATKESGMIWEVIIKLKRPIEHERAARSFP